jgi:hypothetical protein
VNQPPDDPPVRHNPSSGVHIQLGDSNVVFLTITTEKRIPWLATTTAQQFLHETWFKATAWLVGDYLLMPDHINAGSSPFVLCAARPAFHCRGLDCLLEKGVQFETQKEGLEISISRLAPSNT